MFRLMRKFYSPDDSESITPDSKIPASGDKEDDIKFLGTDESDEVEDLLKETKEPKNKNEEKPKKDEVEDETDNEDDKEKNEDEDDELEELVKDLDEEDVDDEKLELATPVRRREILKKYPNLFKDFPYLEKAYYREQQFTELLPTIDDAKQAVEKSQTLDKFESDLMSGNTETILNAVKENDPNTFYKIVDDYLPTLARVDEKAYLNVLGNITKHTIAAMVGEARRSNNEALQSAAQILNQFVFSTSEWIPPTLLAKDVPKTDDKTSELERERQQFTKERFDVARSDLNTKLNNSLKSTIEGNIDPRDSMSEYVKRTAIRDANEQLNTLLQGDKRFIVIIDRLWENAFKKNFSKDSLDQIRSAYLSKAKTLLPSVIKKARNEALKGMGKRVRDNDTDDPKKGPIKNERSRSEHSDKSSKPGEIPKGMRTLDFLNSD